MYTFLNQVKSFEETILGREGGTLAGEAVDQLHPVVDPGKTTTLTG